MLPNVEKMFSPLDNIAESFWKLNLYLQSITNTVENLNEQLNIIYGDSEIIENLNCEDCDWDEMSYKHYCQKLLDFSFSEYADGDWNLE